MTKIVFASCMAADHDELQHVWNEAAAQGPDWLFLCGDNVYLDYGLSLYAPRWWDEARFGRELFSRYSQQLKVESFRSLISSIPPGQVVGTWDDHDFAWNNCFGADAAYGMPQKRLISRALFHHYFNCLNTRPLPRELTSVEFEQLPNHPNSGQEIYRAFDLGPFRVLVCDGRFHREDPSHVSGPASLLGAEQERWLLRELSTPHRKFLIVSGSTMTEGEDQSWDFYGDFFANRFLPAIAGKTVAFVAGDVHENRLPDHTGMPIEIVSSGAALGIFVPRRNYGLLDVTERELSIFLFREGRIEYTGYLNLNTGTFKNSAVLAKAIPKIAPSTARARAQRRAAAKRVKSIRKDTLLAASQSRRLREPRVNALPST
jgi:alkaline phosphatase D